MKRARTVLPIFLLLLVVSVIIFFFLQTPLLKTFQPITIPIQKWMFTTFAQVQLLPSTDQTKLQQENNALRTQLAKMQEIDRDNKALRDQFQTTNPAPKALLPATVIGMSDNQMIIDQGEDTNVHVGDTIVVKDNVIGKVAKSSPRSAVVQMITDPTTSFTAATAKTGAIGVVKAQGGDSITLENVVLTDKLENNDLVITKGDVDARGNGYPPKLVVGKIVSVNKKASNLFQLAQLKSLVDFQSTRIVFVQTN